MSSVIDLLLDHSLTLILFTCLLVLAFHVFSASWLPGQVTVVLQIVQLLPQKGSYP